jgi:hypothetical protein
MSGDAKPEDFAKHIDERTKLIYTESIGNPKYTIADISGLSKVSSGLRMVLFFVADSCSLGRSCARHPPHRRQHLWYGRCVFLSDHCDSGYRKCIQDT